MRPPLLCDTQMLFCSFFVAFFSFFFLFFLFFVSFSFWLFSLFLMFFEKLEKPILFFLFVVVSPVLPTRVPKMEESGSMYITAGVYYVQFVPHHLPRLAGNAKIKLICPCPMHPSAQLHCEHVKTQGTMAENRQRMEHPSPPPLWNWSVWNWNLQGADSASPLGWDTDARFLATLYPPRADHRT